MLRIVLVLALIAALIFACLPGVDPGVFDGPVMLAGAPSTSSVGLAVASLLVLLRRKEGRTREGSNTARLATG